MTYYGQTSRPFKIRFYEHKQAMKNESSTKETALSRFIWKLKNEGKNFDINWSIHARAQTYQSGSKKCQLCTKEKLAIALHDPNTLLNNRKEILGKCIHVRNFELRNPKTPPWEGTSKKVFFEEETSPTVIQDLCCSISFFKKVQRHLHQSFMIQFLSKRGSWKSDTSICHYLFLLFHNS